MEPISQALLLFADTTYEPDGTITSIGKVSDSFPVDYEHPPDGLLYTDEIPEGRGIILNYIIQNGEFVYSPRTTEREDKTEEEEVTYP